MSVVKVDVNGPFLKCNQVFQNVLSLFPIFCQILKFQVQTQCRIFPDISIHFFQLVVSILSAILLIRR